MLDFSLRMIAQISDPSRIGVPQPGSGETQVDEIFRVVFIFAAAISVLVIVIAGLSYVLSTGDPQKTAKAKDTILYAIIGLVVSIFAATIVSFVLDRII